MVFENKEFTKLKGYDNYYICKETTEVLSTKDRKNTTKGTIKVLKQVNNSKDPSNNYFIVTLVDEAGKRGNKAVHRLMAETFLQNPENKAHVNHIDGNKLNNSITNLEWATEKENSQHAVDTGLTTYTHCEKEVHQYTLSGTYLASFKSDAEANDVTGVAKQNISKVTLGHRTQAGGYQWKRFKEDSIPSVPDKIVRKFYVLDTNTNNLYTCNKIIELASLVSVSKTSLHNRFRLSDDIVVNNFQITKTYFD